MKRFLAIALTASLALVAGSASAKTFASYLTDPSNTAAGGVAESRHNLGAYGQHVITTGTTEICVFCHTPHHTNTSAAPLWNRSTDASSTYTAYGSTIAGSQLTSVSGPASLACLSCHDGVTAFDNLINAPGKGGVTTNGARMGWTFAEGGTDVTSPGFVPGTDGWVDSTVPGNAGGANMTFDGVPSRVLIGQDLRNDHPISVDYLGNQAASLRDKGTLISTIDLAGGLNTTGAADANMLQNRWAVKGFISTTATINDILREGKVECSSCHDPHFRNLSWDEHEAAAGGDALGGTDGLFLRRIGGNSGSGVCRTCHNK